MSLRLNGIKNIAGTKANVPVTVEVVPTGTRSLLLHMDGNAGDSSGNNITATNAGVTFSSTDKVFVGGFGDQYAVFNSTSDVLRYVNSSLFTFGTGMFAIDCWVRITGNTGQYGGERHAFLVDAGMVTGSNVDQWAFYLEGSGTTTGTGLGFAGYQGAAEYRIVAPYAFSKNVWYHVGVSRDSSGAIRLHVNGERLTPTTNNFTPLVNIGNRTQYPVRIGQSEVTGWTYNLIGQIDELRIAKGTYFPNSFTPPTAPYA